MRLDQRVLVDEGRSPWPAAGELDGKAGLADSARPTEDDERVRGEHRLERLDLGLAADERRPDPPPACDMRLVLAGREEGWWLRRCEAQQPLASGKVLRAQQAAREPFLIEDPEVPSPLLRGRLQRLASPLCRAAA